MATNKEIQMGLLDQKTQIIKHKIKTVENNFLDIGMELKEIRDNKIYKEKYSSFEKYIEQNFEFNVRTAHRMIQIVEQPNVHNHLLPFSKWVELLSAPVEMREELAKEAEKLSEKELREKIDNAPHVVDDTQRICKKCDRIFNNLKLLSKHELTCIGKSCPKCNFIPASKKASDLKRHLKTCKGEKKESGTEEKQTTIIEKESEIIENQNPVIEKEFSLFSIQMEEMSKKTVPKLVHYVSRSRFKQINIQRRVHLRNHINTIIKQLQVVEKNLR